MKFLSDSGFAEAFKTLDRLHQPSATQTIIRSRILLAFGIGLEPGLDDETQAMKVYPSPPESLQESQIAFSSSLLKAVLCTLVFIQVQPKHLLWHKLPLAG